MPTFSPPTEEGIAWGDTGDEYNDKLMKYYGGVTTGMSVWQDQDEEWHMSQYPYLGRPDSPGLLQAQQVYVGGHVHTITDAQADELTDAGFGEFINVADVEMNWDRDSLGLLTRSRVSVSDPNNNPVYSYEDDLHGTWTLSNGPIQDGGQRDWYLHHGIDYENFEVNTMLNNPQYNVSGRLQQAGIVLRYQEDPDNDSKTGITINNNVFFFVPVINVGVWKSNMEGTAMFNRQYGFPVESIFPDPYFPFHLDIRLEENICRVRTYLPSTQPPEWQDDLTSDTRSKAINLDVDAGAPGEVATAPTPVGRGGGGFIVAHLGVNAFMKFPKTRFHNLDNQGAS